MLKTWITIPENSDFSIYNLPFGIFSTEGTSPRVGVAIGDLIIDLAALAQKGIIDVPLDALHQPYLNPFIQLGKSVTNGVRTSLQAMLCDENSALKGFEKGFVAQAVATMHLPVDVRDYTDFYSSIEHASNSASVHFQAHET